MTRFSNRIRLFWWNEKIIQGKTRENYGDLLGKYLVEKISEKKVVFAWPKKISLWDFFEPIYFTVGSILTNVNSKCIVWGSGIISQQSPIKKAKFLSVRGPQTRKFLIDLGYEVPEVFGDPALLLPRFFNPMVEKKYRYGIIPHYNDWKFVKECYKDRTEIVLIDMMTDDIESKTIAFLQCEKIVSSSLHGIIVAHAYGIPAVWQKFSDKVFGDDIKYQDYLESVELEFYRPKIKETPFSEEDFNMLFENLPSLPREEVLEDLCNGLMKVCPFKKELKS